MVTVTPPTLSLAKGRTDMLTAMYPSMDSPPSRRLTASVMYLQLFSLPSPYAYANVRCWIELPNSFPLKSVNMISVMVSLGITSTFIRSLAVSWATRNMPSACPPKPAVMVSSRLPGLSIPMHRMAFIYVLRR